MITTASQKHQGSLQQSVIAVIIVSEKYMCLNMWAAHLVMMKARPREAACVAQLPRVLQGAAAEQAWADASCLLAQGSSRPMHSWSSQLHNGKGWGEMQWSGLREGRGLHLGRTETPILALKASLPPSTTSSPGRAWQAPRTHSGGPSSL